MSKNEQVGQAPKHTPGPWRIHTSGSIYAGPLYLATTVGEAEKGDANARRIVACVNAAEGIPTESLERGSAWSQLAQHTAKVEALNKELVEALEDARECAYRIKEDIGYGPMTLGDARAICLTLFDRISAVLVKVKS